MRFLPRALLAGGLGFAISFLVACGGGSGLLTGAQSDGLSNQISSVSAAVGGHDCIAVARALARLGSKVSDLPVTVNPTLRANLAQGVSTVGVLATRDCRGATTSSTSSTTTTTPTTSTTTTTPTTTQTSTTSTTSTTTSTTTPSSTTTPATSTTTTGTTSTTGGTGGAGLGGASGGAGTGRGNNQNG